MTSYAFKLRIILLFLQLKEQFMENHPVYLTIKFGFPLLWVIVTIMALVAIWTDKRKAKPTQWLWTALVVLLPFLGVGIYLGFGYR